MISQNTLRKKRFRIVDELDGYMPLRIQAIPDGNWVPRGTPFCQIKNTVEGFGECVTWWEAMLMHAWFPSACATEAFYMRKYLDSKKLSANRFHSFGFRGHRSLEDTYWAGTAWNLVPIESDSTRIPETCIPISC